MDRLLAIRDEILSRDPHRRGRRGRAARGGASGRYLAADTLARRPGATAHLLGDGRVRGARGRGARGRARCASRPRSTRATCRPRPLGAGEAARIFTGAHAARTAPTRSSARRRRARRGRASGSSARRARARTCGARARTSRRGALALGRGDADRRAPGGAARAVGADPVRSAAAARRDPLHRRRGRLGPHARLERRRARGPWSARSAACRRGAPSPIGSRTSRAALDGRARRGRRGRHDRRRVDRRAGPRPGGARGARRRRPRPRRADEARQAVPVRARGAGSPCFGLPGSPSACLAAFEVFARPALLALAGAARRERTVDRRCGSRSRSTGGPGARVSCGRASSPAAPRGRSGRTRRRSAGPALADALLLVPAGAGDLARRCGGHGVDSRRRRSRRSCAAAPDGSSR